MHPSCPITSALISGKLTLRWQEEAEPPCQSSQTRVDKVERTERVRRGGVELLLERQGGLGRREEWVRFSYSCRGVDIPDWGSRIGRGWDEAGVAWFNFCLISQRMLELEIMSLEMINQPVYLHHYQQTIMDNWLFDKTYSSETVFLNVFSQGRGDSVITVCNHYILMSPFAARLWSKSNWIGSKD